MKRPTLLSIFLTVSLVLPAAAQDSEVDNLYVPLVGKQTLTIQVPDFKELPEGRREAAVEAIFTSIREMEFNLIEQLKNKKLSPDSKDAIITILGGLRADVAVPILVENIDFRRPTKPGDELPPTRITRNWYPARDALRLIGDPATSWIIRIIGSTLAPQWTMKEHTAVDGFVEVLRDSLGQDGAVAHLAAREKSATDPAVKERYKQFSFLVQNRQAR